MRDNNDLIDNFQQKFPKENHATRTMKIKWNNLFFTFVTYETHLCANKKIASHKSVVARNKHEEVMLNHCSGAQTRTSITNTD